MGLRWSHLNWPAIGYVSLEDDEGYADHLTRLVTDAPPTVALLANVKWQDARVAGFHIEQHDPETDLSTVVLITVTRNDEVVDAPNGLWRRWNHARVSLRFDDARFTVRGGMEPEELDLLGGDVSLARVELDHTGIDHEHDQRDRWVLRMIAWPTGEATITFADVTLDAESVDEHTYTELENRPPHGWHGPVPDGWVRFATPPVRTASEGDLGGLALVLEHQDLNALDPRWGISALHAAAWFDRDALIGPLVGRGASVDLVDTESRTPLTLAIDRGARAAATALVQAGADLEARDSTENTPILHAASAGQADIVRDLAAAGADITARGARGATLLIAAADTNDADTVQAALDLGADTTAVDDDGNTALARARLHHERIAESILMRTGSFSGT